MPRVITRTTEDDLREALRVLLNEVGLLHSWNDTDEYLCRAASEYRLSCGSGIVTEGPADSEIPF